MTQLYLYYGHGQKPEVLNLKQIHDYVLREQLSPYEFVYETTAKKWSAIQDLELFRALHVKMSQKKSPSSKEKPQNHPDEVDVSKFWHKAIKEEYELIEMYFSKLINRNRELTKIIEDQNLQIKSYQHKSNQEIKRLTGESFEISNKNIWLYKQSAKEHGPYNFEQILQYKREGKISTTTLLKNTETNSTWMALKDYFEFDAPFETVLTHEGGHAVKRYFMKRTSIRVPIYEIMGLFTEQAEYKGYCTSLSLGGCFIELTRIKPDEFKKDESVDIVMSGEVLGTELNISGVIRNISLSRPKGLGIMFDELDFKSREVIEKYITDSLEKIQTNKA